MTTGPINPHDAVNRLFNQGAKQVASTFGAMSKKTEDQKKIEKQSSDISKEYQLFDNVNTSKELEDNAKNTGLVNQSLTNKELEKEEELVLEGEYSPYGKEKKTDNVSGSFTNEEVIEEGTRVSSNLGKTSVAEDERLFEELAKNVGANAKEIKEAAYSEVLYNLENNPKEMRELKVTNDTSYIETNILKDDKPATSEIKEGKLIMTNAKPIPVERANELF